MSGNIWVCGDIHGAHKALVQCLERSGFDRDKDTLIQLGDVCDGYTEVYECVEELLSIKNLIALKGNHDEPFEEWLFSGIHPWKWDQGGQGTKKSYQKYCSNMDGFLISDLVPVAHREFFRKQLFIYTDEENHVFVHAGFDRNGPPKGQNPLMYMWDRSLVHKAMSCTNGQKLKFTGDVNEVFLGHTTTLNWGTDQPIYKGGV